MNVDNVKLIGISGKARSGKDSLEKAMRKLDGKQRRMLFAEPIKQMLLVMTAGNLPLEPGGGSDDYDKNALVPGFDKTLRFMMQTLGTDWGRNTIDPEIWIKVADKYLYGSCCQPDRVVYTDVRFDNEAQFIRDHNGIIVEISRYDRDCSEHGINPGLVDMFLLNNGPISDLDIMAKNILNKFDTIIALRRKLNVS
jgi:hypothetical protein